MIDGSGASKVLGGSDSDLQGNISRVSGRWRKKMSKPLDPSRIGKAISKIAAKSSVFMGQVNQVKKHSPVAGKLYIEENIDDTYFRNNVVKAVKEKIK